MVDYIQTNIYSKNTIKSADVVQTLSFRRHLRVIPLKMETDKKTFDSKELNMYFESPESFHSYEIEMEDVHVKSAREFNKAHDFLRRLNYKYDWIHFEKSDKGKITKVFNQDELRKNWVNLKERVLKDYKGEMVVSYLSKISEDFENDEHFRNLFSQYYEYGLLYSPIPEKHNERWTTKRVIKLDNTPQTELLETITFKGIDGNIREYVLDWEKHNPDSPIEIKEAKGDLEYCTLSNTLKKAEVYIMFAYDDTIINKWNFRLEKVEILKNQTL